LGKFDFHSCIWWETQGGQLPEKQGKKKVREGLFIYNVWFCYLQCWCCCCCIYFAGYQHGLVSKLCVWLHPESRRGREKKENRIKIKKRKKMRRGGKRNIKIACEVKYKHKPVTCEKLHTKCT